MPRLRSAPKPETAIKGGVYLTDVSEDPKGKGLYRVLAVLETNVELEDCARPNGVPSWLSVSEVARRMRLVRPR